MNRRPRHLKQSAWRRRRIRIDAFDQADPDRPAHPSIEPPARDARRPSPPAPELALEAH